MIMTAVVLGGGGLLGGGEKTSPCKLTGAAAPVDCCNQVTSKSPFANGVAANSLTSSAFDPKLKLPPISFPPEPKSCPNNMEFGNPFGPFVPVCALQMSAKSPFAKATTTGPTV